MINMELQLGLDIGNGYVKGKFTDSNGNPVKIDMPSCVAGMPEQPPLPASASDKYIANIFNNQCLKFKSPIVADMRHFLFGESAIMSGRVLTQFDITTTNLSKADQELSSQLVLGCVAGATLQNYWNMHKSLPQDVINVKVCVALALPIDEYMTHRDSFANKFKNSTHEVLFTDFDMNVTIRIDFITVNVLPEGVSAQFAIAEMGVALAEALLDDVRSHDATALQGITANDVVQCVNTLGIDIGEGTVNMPVIKNGSFNPVASDTLQRGWGSVLEQALPRVNRANISFDSRKALADFLVTPETAFNRNKKRTCHDILSQDSVDLAELIINKASKVLSGGNIELIYVYGGGATPMKPVLNDRLTELVRSFSGNDAFPILYLDSEYSRNLNREGLYQVAVADWNATGLK